MTPERWRQVAAIFDAALAQPEAERHAWVAAASEGDAELQREAEALLRAHETAGDFLEEPAQLEASEEGDALPPGTQLGAYRILHELGRGGMGVVYLAEDQRLGRRVAVKSLPGAVTFNEELRARLRREARAAATISHPAVATVYALEESDGHLFIVSEYVDGRTLRELIEAGPLPAARAGAIALDVARALCAAHDAGVIHRDLKPENVLITDAGAVKVVDFGVAHVEGPEATRLTRAGAMLGTPAYMAPEQLVGGSIDARADLYAFGVVFSEALTGVHPLRRSSHEARPPVPAAFAAIVARCTQPDPAQRFASARELVAALENATADAGAPHAAPVLPPNQALADPPRRAHTPLWWWEFHQAVTASIYWLMMIPAWAARGALGGVAGRTFFIAALAAVVVAANLRLHLWFTSRFYPEELRWVRRRTGRFIRAADYAFALVLLGAGLYIGDDNPPLSVLLISFAIGAAVAFLVIEPVTTRAAFRGSRGTSAGG